MPQDIISTWDAQAIAAQYARPDSALSRFALYRELDGPIVSELHAIMRRKRAGIGDVRKLYAYVCDCLVTFATAGVMHDEWQLLPASVRELAGE